MTLIAVRVLVGSGPELFNDSFQYLSAASNALEGRAGSTSIVHFDAERSFGTIPAPLVTFPSGYPLLIALLGLSGMPLEWSALLVSAVASVASVLLLASVIRRTEVSRPVLNLALGLFVMNAAIVQFGAAAMSEALFVTLMLLGVSLLVRAHTATSGRRLWLWVGAGLAVGAAYHVRYAGLFLVASLAILALRYLITRDRAMTIGHLAAFAVASVVALIGMLRNIQLVGDWRGGNEKPVSNPVLSVVGEMESGFVGLITGGRGWTVAIGGVLMLALGVAVAWFILRHRTDWPRMDGTRTRARIIAVDVAIIAAVYASGILYAGMTSVISVGARLLLPLTPLLIILAAIGLQALFTMAGRAGRTRPVALGLAVAMAGYVIANSLAFAQRPANGADLVAQSLDQVRQGQVSPREALRDLVPDGGVILANNGQAMGYETGAPTISMVGPHFSGVTWDEHTVREVIDRYDISAVVITPGSGDGDLIPSAFVQALADGQGPPWLELVGDYDDVLIYAPGPPAPGGSPDTIP